MFFIFSMVNVDMTYVLTSALLYENSTNRQQSNKMLSWEV